MDLLITLGHNSSAILVNRGKVINGYEEERFTRIKSDSHFPLNAINEILKRNPDGLKGGNLFISHWYDDFDFYTEGRDGVPEKHFNRTYIKNLIHKYNLNIFALDEKFTHHDAHCRSVLEFYNNFADPVSPMHCIVCDGFGNNQEVLSVYRIDNDNPKLIKRKYGYMNSLGLMYQYATAFCGMKMNQDEYKFLGYESHILEVLGDEEIGELEYRYENKAKEMFEEFLIDEGPISEGKYININELDKTKQEWFKILEKISDDDEFTNRAKVGFFIQGVLETFLVLLVKHYQIENLICSGGVFYNVKLNNRLLNAIEGRLSIIPVCGDQGAAIGLYCNYSDHGFYFKDLCFGKRDVGPMTDEMIDQISEYLKQDKVVNVVVGDMEFGPRALCNTTTLALPSIKNVNYINKLNKRNDVMPMAPVINKKTLQIFNETEYTRIVGSDKFMIVTYHYKDNKFLETIPGVMHRNPLVDVYTGRPQVVSDEHFMSKIMDIIGQNVLINTSYNIHGKPIVYSSEDAMNDFNYQKTNDDQDKVVLVMSKNE